MKMPVNDSWIAATAMAHELPMVTRDADYVQLPGLTVIRVLTPNLLIAAVAERNRVTVLHYDAAFDTIASNTGRATQWLVERGSVL